MSFIDPDQFEKDVKFSPVDLDSAMIQQASFAAHYGVLAAKASQAAGKEKIRLQTAEAKAYKDIRDAAANEKVKMTEAQISAEVSVTPMVLNAKLKYNDALYQAELGRVASEAFRQRRDMLVQVGKDARDERQGELLVRKAAG